MFRPRKDRDIVEVYYDDTRWRLLKRKRAKGLKLLRIFRTYPAVLHGSVARGDVRPESDVEIAILEPISYSIVRYLLEQEGLRVDYVEFVMATPKTTPKLYMYVQDPEDELVVTIPIVRLSKIEEEFYRFSGCVDLSKLEQDVRVPGVNKNLMLVIPTEFGHIEMSVIGREGEVARTLGVSISVVRERVEMLRRRAEIGHTGLFIDVELNPDDPVEQIVVEELEKRNVRWVLKELGYA